MISIDHNASPSRAFWLLVIAAGTLVCSGCEDDDAPVPPPENRAAATSAPAPKTKTPNESVELEGWRIPNDTDLDAPSSQLERRALSLKEPRRFGDCQSFLERDGAPKNRLPHTGRPLRIRLFSCNIPAVERTDKRLYLAYAVPDDTHEGTDLRLSVYDTETDDDAPPLVWSHRMDRRSHSDHFRADLRESFIAPLPPNVVCTGTLWSDSTQVSCLSFDGSTVEWSGSLNFWSSIPLTAAAEGLVGADITGLTRRYPFSGVEMEGRQLPGRGGHSALYGVFDDRLVYAPEPPLTDDDYPLTLSAWNLESFEPIWRRKLPARPDSAVDYLTFEPYIFIKLQQQLVAVDIHSGSPAWSVGVGSDRPKMARADDTLYLLLRRRQASNLLYALDFKTGDVQWFARTPTGSLDVATFGETVALKSIRAVEVIDSVDPVPDDAPAIDSTTPDPRGDALQTDPTETDSPEADPGADDTTPDAGP